jgi:hypothetical protein
MRTTAYRTVCVMLATVWGLAAGCADHSTPTALETAVPALSLARAPQGFTIGPLGLSGIEQAFPGPNWHLQEVQLTGPVAGDMTGEATITLNANLDGLGNGPVFGKVTITTSDGAWQGSLTGHFQGDLPTGILLTSQVTLHGPGHQLLKAECDETPPSNSETLACSGEVQIPGD